MTITVEEGGARVTASVFSKDERQGIAAGEQPAASNPFVTLSRLNTLLAGVGGGLDTFGTFVSNASGGYYILWDGTFFIPADVADMGAAINAALADLSNQGVIRLPGGTFTFATRIVISKQCVIEGSGGIDRYYFGEGSFTQLVYSGSGHALEVTDDDGSLNAGAGIFEGIVFRDLLLKPAVSGGGTDGVQLQGNSGETYAILSVLFERVHITDWGNDGVLLKGSAFDVTFQRAAITKNRRYGVYTDSTGNQAGPPSQISFIDSWLLAYSSSTSWCARISAESTRWLGGTVAALSGGNGIWIEKGAVITGTSIEGSGSTGIGCRYTGSLVLDFAPGICGIWATGLQVGDPSNASAAALNWIVRAEITSNTTDVHVVDGGLRYGGQIQATGAGSGAPVILDERFTVGGSMEWVHLSEYNAGGYHYLKHPGRGSYLKQGIDGQWIARGQSTITRLAAHGRSDVGEEGVHLFHATTASFGGLNFLVDTSGANVGQFYIQGSDESGTGNDNTFMTFEPRNGYTGVGGITNMAALLHVYRATGVASGYIFRAQQAGVSQATVSLAHDNGELFRGALASGSTPKRVIDAEGRDEYHGTMGNSSKVVGTDAPADWIECKIGATTCYIPVYAA